MPPPAEWCRQRLAGGGQHHNTTSVVVAAAGSDGDHPAATTSRGGNLRTPPAACVVVGEAEAGGDRHGGCGGKEESGGSWEKKGSGEGFVDTPRSGGQPMRGCFSSDDAIRRRSARHALDLRGDDLAAAAEAVVERSPLRLVHVLCEQPAHDLGRATRASLIDDKAGVVLGRRGGEEEFNTPDADEGV